MRCALYCTLRLTTLLALHLSVELDVRVQDEEQLVVSAQEVVLSVLPSLKKNANKCVTAVNDIDDVGKVHVG